MTASSTDFLALGLADPLAHPGANLPVPDEPLLLPEPPPALLALAGLLARIQAARLAGQPGN